MSYENFPGYPEYKEGIGYGFFGYPSASLENAIRNDDVEAFRFYFDRYFSIDSDVLGGETLLQKVERMGAAKIAEALRKLGAK